MTIKLYLQRHAAGWIWPLGHRAPALALGHLREQGWAGLRHPSPSPAGCIFQAPESVSSQQVSRTFDGRRKSKARKFPSPCPQIQSSSQTASLPSPKLQPLPDVCATVPASSRNLQPWALPIPVPPSILPAFLLWVSAQSSAWTSKAFPSPVLPNFCVYKLPQFKKLEVVSFLFLTPHPSWIWLIREAMIMPLLSKSKEC